MGHHSTTSSVEVLGSLTSVKTLKNSLLVCGVGVVGLLPRVVRSEVFERYRGRFQSLVETGAPSKSREGVLNWLIAERPLVLQ